MTRASFLSVIVLAANVAASAAGSASAHSDYLLLDYRFVPSRSTVEVSGGFAGIERTYAVRGDFGLEIGYESGFTCQAMFICPPPPEVPYARFAEVDAWMVPDGMLPYLWSLDDTLNLTGLRGTFYDDDRSRLFFHGTDGQDQPIRLQATLRGRWLHLTGENDPDCCDFFHYKIDALAHLRPLADLNHDDAIDAADFVLWRKTDGSTDKHAAWQADFGTDLSAEAAAFLATVEAESSAHTAAVPEPAALVLLVLGGGLSCLAARRR